VSLETTFLRGYKSGFCSAEGTKYYQNFNRTVVLTAQVKLVVLQRVSRPCKGWLTTSWKDIWEQILTLNLLVTCNKTCEISGSYCSDVKDSSLLGCDAVSFSESFPTFSKDCRAFTCQCLAVQGKFFSCHVWSWR